MSVHGLQGEANSDESPGQYPLEDRSPGKGILALKLLKQGTPHVLGEAGGRMKCSAPP